MAGGEQETALLVERGLLVRLCLRLTGDASAAEDLAQEALLVAWQQEQTLRDPDRRTQWLYGIARNLCLHWRRHQGLERARSAPPSAEGALPGSDDRADGTVDLESDLDRSELVDLLDRAMALLPAETRAVLVARYVEESPHADVAAHLGLSEDAVKKRVERGKAMLQRVLTTSLRSDALASGLLAPDTQGWQQTRVWCPGCGRHRLHGRFRPAEGELLLRCPGCTPPGHNHYVNSHLGDGFAGLRTIKPALSRVQRIVHGLYHIQPADGAMRYCTCGTWVPIRQGRPAWEFSGTDDDSSGYFCIWCPTCGLYDGETWHTLTLSLPEAQRFWKDNPRVHFLPARQIEVGGSPAMVTGFESLTGAARLEVVTLRDSLRVIGIHGPAACETSPPAESW